jgi:hypothetical protein
VLAQIGLNSTAAITKFYSQIKLRQGLLTGDCVGCRECHIKFGLIRVTQITQEAKGFQPLWVEAFCQYTPVMGSNSAVRVLY